MIKLIFNNKPLPFGAMVKAGERTGIVGDDGQVYLSGMPDKGVVQVKWGDGPDKQCKADYRLPIKQKNQPVQRFTVSCE